MKKDEPKKISPLELERIKELEKMKQWKVIDHELIKK